MPRPNAPWYRRSKDCWYVKIQGKCLSLGVRGADSQSSALAAFHRLLANPRSEREKKVPSKAVLAAEVLTFFNKSAPDRLKPRTITQYKTDADSFANFCGTNEPTRALVEGWLASLRVSTTTKAVRLRSVSAVFGWATREGLIQKNPTDGVHRPRPRSRSSKSIVSEEDHHKLLAAANKWIRPVLILLYATGCRPGEVGKLTVENYHPELSLFQLAEHKSDRTGELKNIFLPDDVNELVKGWALERKSGPILLTKRGTAWRANAITWALKRLADRTGVKVMAYGYRHAFATRALTKGESDTVVAALLGHSSTAMVHLHYNHVGQNAKAMREAVSRITS